MQRENVETYYSRCDCTCELLAIEVQKDYNNEAEICIYSLYGKMPFIQRLRYLWQILTEGRPYGDQVVLQKEEMHRLRDFLVEHYRD